MRITVLIPTYRRSQDLLRCLQALKQQSCSPDEVIVVVRDSDTETTTSLVRFEAESLPLKVITVSIPGQVAALNTGLDQANGEIVAITDDDAVPHAHWLATIKSHFLADARVGGVGGRDWLYHGGTELEEGSSLVVGKVQWFGRLVGRHNLGVGVARDVEFLKGANMSYRTSAIAHLRFDTRLLGTGAQVHNDLAFSLAVKHAGWRLIYDPVVEIDHYQAKRFDEDQRYEFNESAFLNAVHNETVALLDYLSPLRSAVFFLWAILIGTRKAFGIIQWLRFLPIERRRASQKLWLSFQGRWQGFQTWRKSKKLAGSYTSAFNDNYANNATTPPT